MVIFEDSPDSAISKLIRHLMGSNVMFACGNERVSSCIEQALKSGETVVCYVDACCDNEDAHTLYEEYCSYYEDNSSVTVLPIPCIEFVVLRMLVDIGAIPLTVDVRTFINSLSGIEIKYDAKSYERFCKSVLNSSSKRCVRNKTKGNLVSFYSGSCECGIEEYYAKNCSRFTLLQKMLALAYYLPYYETKHDFSKYVSAGLLHERTVDEAVVECDRIMDNVDKAIGRSIKDA